MSAFSNGDDCVVLFVPVRPFCPGSNVLPISLASSVIGTDDETGSPVSDGVDGAAIGGETFGIVGAGGKAGTAGAVVGVVGVAIFGSVVGNEVGNGTIGSVIGTGVVAAPTGPPPANTVAAARTRPPAATAADDRGFRLNVLLLLCMGYTDPL
jgi:hypothetical protein